MSCPVVRAIEELYGSFDYAASNGASEYIPSGVSGGGYTSTSVSMESAKFYITMRKLQYARAELSAGNLGADTPIANALGVSAGSKYFERMFAQYYGKNSQQILAEILGRGGGLYLAMTRAVDIIDIMEGVCCTVLARDFPSGMSLPTVVFDPDAIENINRPVNICREVNKIIDYANKLCIGGVTTKIPPLPEFTAQLRDFTFARAEYSQLFAEDMEVAEYAHALEQYQCAAIEKINAVMELCQSVIDLSKK
jgi:hypothetical protein